MTEYEFSNPRSDEMSYGEIVPVYQAAFAGDPWYESSKCVDRQVPQRCLAGLSAVSVGQLCELCSAVPAELAYPAGPLTSRFQQIAQTRPSSWYLERTNGDLTLAGLAWKADAQRVAAEKYQGIPEMESWLTEALGESNFVWLDEVFADRQKKPSGNLRNFGAMCLGFGWQLNRKTLSFRTISPQMVAAAKRNFGDQARIFERNIDVPDRRDFVAIDLSQGVPRWKS